ncbi:MAG: tetratricopeptide repeat protein [Deltaproteobacteria bacterium]|nr:tetratricopeptide repeat protein [Deltaproteobacteria bacterium]
MTFHLFEAGKEKTDDQTSSSESLHIYIGPPQLKGVAALSEPQVPWQNGQNNDLSSLLSWDNRLSRFAGRDGEMKSLEKWALSQAPVSIQWVTGAGGVGKSRLAAEFCTYMKEQHNWPCGFAKLDQPKTFAFDQEGLLLVVETPEDKKDSVRELFQDLAALDQKQLAEKGKKIRLLFLSRQAFENWQSLIFETGAETLANPIPVELTTLPFNAALDIFRSTFSKAVGRWKMKEKSVAEEQVEIWLRQNDDNRRPQYIVAAAVFHALFPDEHISLFNSRELVEKLALQEIAGAERIATKAGLKEPLIFPILQVIATISRRLTSERAERLIKTLGLDKDLPEGTDIVSFFENAGLLHQKKIVPIKPDLFAAAYLIEVLKRKPAVAHKIIWNSLGSDFLRSLPRFSRLCFDAEKEFDFQRRQLDQWLYQEIVESPDNGAALEPFLAGDMYGLTETGITACRVALERTETETQKIRLNDKLSLFYQALGDQKEALRQRIFAVDMCEKLASDKPDTYEVELARHYFNLWKILSDTGERGKAYRVIVRTAELYQQLVKKQPRKLKLLAAESLKNLGEAYAEAGEWEKALTTLEKVLEVYEELARIQPLAFGPALATCLNSQGDLCSQLKETEKALMATAKSVHIYERLTSTRPGHYEAGLATSLTNLGNRYVDTGEMAEALRTIQRALEIYEELAEARPETFEADLAGCLSIAGNLYAFMGDTEKALEITERVVEIYSKLAKETAVYDSLLASSLNNLSSRYASAGEDVKALISIDTAVKIYESLAANYPLVFDPHLATSLNRLGLGYAALGDYRKALSATEEAIEIYSKLVSAQPEDFEPDLAGCLNNQGNLYAKMGEPERALVATEMAVNIKEQLASADPQKFIPSLIKSLNNLEQRYYDIGEEEKARMVRKRAEEFQEKYLETVEVLP